MRRRSARIAVADPSWAPQEYEGGTLIRLGASGATVDISNRVAEWSVAVQANPDEANGRFPSSGLYVGRWWYGPKRTAIPELTLFVNRSDTDILDLFRNDTAQELQINLTGAVITNGQPEVYRMDMLWPEIHFTAAEDVVLDNKVAFRMTTGEDGVFQKSGSEYFQVTVTNTTAAYLVAA